MNESLTLQGEDHLVNGGWGDLEVTFSRRICNPLHADGVRAQSIR